MRSSVIARIKKWPHFSNEAMTRSDANFDPRRRRVRWTAWIVGVIAATIYVVSIIEVVLRR